MEPRVGSRVACARTRNFVRAVLPANFARFARDDPLSRHLADRRRRSDRGPRRKPRRRRDRRAGRGQPVFSGRKRPDAPRRCRHSNSSSSRGARPSTTLTKQSVFSPAGRRRKPQLGTSARALAGEFWSDLVACRLTVAYDRANQFDRAMVAFFTRCGVELPGRPRRSRSSPEHAYGPNGGLWSGGWRTGGRPVRRCAAGSARPSRAGWIRRPAEGLG